MQAIFKINDPRLLLEASPGELFVPLGPRLTECVCVIRACAAGHQVQPDQPTTHRLNPDAYLSVVVVACRVMPGEPEYFPPGFTTELQGACPIVFLEPFQPLMLRPREDRGMSPEQLAIAQAALNGTRQMGVPTTDLTRPGLAGSLAEAARDRLNHEVFDFMQTPSDLTRPELASQL